MNEDIKVKTLEQLIYDVRHYIGEIKDHLLETLASGQTPAFLENHKLVAHLNVGYLTCVQGDIQQILLEILKDPLIQSYEDAQVRERAVSKINEMLRAASTIATDMDFKGLVGLSRLGIELYNTIKPFADEARTVDHQTGLRISSYLEEKMFDYLKDHIAHPDRHIAIANIDLNNFKLSNDIVGKSQTDEAIVQLARIMKELPEGLVVRRTEQRGDEFYILFQADAEGAKRIIEKRLFPTIEEKLIPYLKEACEQKYLRSYDPRFEQLGYRYTCAVGISSTYIPNNPDIFVRASIAMNSNKSELKQALGQLHISDPADRHKEYEKLAPELRKKVLLALKQTLFDESEKAMKLSKNTNHNANIVSTYDVNLPEESYVYVSKR